MFTLTTQSKHIVAEQMNLVSDSNHGRIYLNHAAVPYEPYTLGKSCYYRICHSRAFSVREITCPFM